MTPKSIQDRVDEITKEFMRERSHYVSLTSKALFVAWLRTTLATHGSAEYERGAKEERERIQTAISNALWNEDGSLKTHDISMIVSTVIHQTLSPTNPTP